MERKSRYREPKDLPRIFTAQKEFAAGEYEIIARSVPDTERGVGFGSILKIRLSKEYEIVLRTGTGDPNNPVTEQILLTGRYRNGNSAQKAGKKYYDSLS